MQRLVFLFPGQGTVPSAIPETPLSKKLLAHAETLGVPLLEVLAADDAVRLHRADVVQPLIFVDEVTKDALLRVRGIRPDAVAGHSLGEYAALASAGVLDVFEGLDLVVARGRAMRSTRGAMAAIVKLEQGVVADICRQIGDDVVIANHNGERQFVVSGTEPAVAAAAAAAAGRGGRAVPLDVSGPFHSPLMGAAAAEFAALLRRATFKDPSVPVVSAVSGTPEESGDRLQRLMVDQMTAGVQWVDVVRWMASAGVARAIEVGPGRVLSGLGRRIAPGIEFHSFEEATSG